MLLVLPQIVARRMLGNMRNNGGEMLTITRVQADNKIHVVRRRMVVVAGGVDDLPWGTIAHKDLPRGLLQQERISH